MRYKEPPEKGPFCDILWADPANEDDVEHEQYTLKEIGKDGGGRREEGGEEYKLSLAFL